MSIPFAMEIPLKLLPKALQQKPIVQAKALSIYKAVQPDLNGNQIFIGTLVASDAYKQVLRTNGSCSFINELTDVYRDIYGDAPWNEFLSCPKTGCLGKRSIADVYGLPSENRANLSELERNRTITPSDHDCPVCGSPMTFYYSRDELFAMIESEFSEEVVAAFILNHEGDILGFSWAWFADADAVSRKLQAQFKCEPNAPIVATMKNYMQEKGLKEVLLWNEWAVYPVYRKTSYSLILSGCIGLLGEKRAAARGDNDPILIGTTLEGSNAYNGHLKFGAKTIFRDSDTNIVIMTIPVKRGLEYYTRVERVFTKRLLRDKRRKSADRDLKRFKVAV